MRSLREEDAADDEIESAMNRVREVYERAVAQVPPGDLKRHWRRYIFLWLDYALFEELETKVCFISMVFFPFLTFSRTMTDRGKYTELRYKWFHTNNSLLRNCGSCLRILKYGDLIFQQHANCSVLQSACVPRRNSSRDIFNLNLM